jgi:hypothetical protein
MKRSALACLSALCLLLPATASAKPPLTFVSYSLHGIAALDADKGFYESPKGTIQIVNARAGTTRAVVLLAGCEERGISGPDILLACSDEPTVRVWNSWTGDAAPVDLSACDGQPPGIEVTGLGRYWIAGRQRTGYFDDYGEIDYAVYVNRRTSECRVLGQREFFRDLDRPDLPKRRYGRPDRCTRGKAFVERWRRNGLYVKRCARGARWRFVTRNDGAVPGRRLVAWLASGRLHVYLVAGGRRLSWSAPPESDGPTVLGDRVFVDVLDDDPNGIPVYAVDLSPLVGR